jgi:hypothetical protein
MGNHRPASIAPLIDACLDCGLIITQYTDKLSCPPWSTGDKVDAEINQVNELMIVGYLNHIQENIERGQQEFSWDYIMIARNILDYLIKKYGANK